MNLLTTSLSNTLGNGQRQIYVTYLIIIIILLRITSIWMQLCSMSKYSIIKFITRMSSFIINNNENNNIFLDDTHPSKQWPTITNWTWQISYLKTWNVNHNNNCQVRMWMGTIFNYYFCYCLCSRRILKMFQLVNLSILSN